MQQPYSFPGPLAESGAEPADGFRQTAIYRLPQFDELSARLYEPRVEPPSARGIPPRQLAFHLFLLGLTVLTTTIAVGFFWFGDLGQGAIYSLTVLSILGAHEMGHYIACRWYGVEATLPYFIPMPFPPVGTFGAFIKMRSPILTRRALFDIGIAGPLAGYVFAIPAAFIGHYFAQSVQPSTELSGITINDPLLFKFLQHALHLPSTLLLNPVMWAAWVGVFMTSLNLLPVGQLDGGHVTYALFGPRFHRALAIFCFTAVVGLAAFSVLSGNGWNWVVYGVLLTFVIRVGHPPVIDEREPLGAARILIALIGLMIFILSFIPIPFSFS